MSLDLFSSPFKRALKASQHFHRQVLAAVITTVNLDDNTVNIKIAGTDQEIQRVNITNQGSGSSPVSGIYIGSPVAIMFQEGSTLMYNVMTGQPLLPVGLTGSSLLPPQVLLPPGSTASPFANAILYGLNLRAGQIPGMYISVQVGRVRFGTTIKDFAPGLFDPIYSGTTMKFDQDTEFNRFCKWFTVPASDGSYQRVDVITVSGPPGYTFNYYTGTPAAQPQEPVYDTGSQLKCGNFLVRTSTTAVQQYDIDIGGFVPDPDPEDPTTPIGVINLIDNGATRDPRTPAGNIYQIWTINCKYLNDRGQPVPTQLTTFKNLYILGSDLASVRPTTQTVWSQIDGNGYATFELININPIGATFSFQVHHTILQHISYIMNIRAV